MSLSKEQSIEYNYRRDSFSDRVCDDLCQHILQYMPLEDKLRLECVSKQFQRTAFISQRRHIIDYNNYNSNDKNLGILLKKLPNIRLIRIIYAISSSKRNQLIELIIKYCNNLTHFDFNFHFMDKDIQKKFIEKFGHKLLSVNVDKKYFWSLNEMPNIEELTLHSEDNKIPNIHFKRLKRFDFNLRLDMDLNEFKVFIERNAKTITHLELCCYPKSMKSKENFKHLLTIISSLKNLVYLSISSGFAFNDNSFTQQLSQIALNCNQLKSLVIDYDLEINEDSIGDHFLFLRQFKRLKRLELLFGENLSPFLVGNYLKSHRFFSLKANTLSELTHFCITFGLPPLPIYRFIRPEVSDIIFIDMDIGLPKLQSLTIKRIPIYPGIDVKCRLTKLKSINLWSSHEKYLDFIHSFFNVF